MSDDADPTTPAAPDAPSSNSSKSPTRGELLKSGARLITIGGAAFGIASGLDQFGVTLLDASFEGLLLYASIVANVWLAVELVLSVRRRTASGTTGLSDLSFPRLLVAELRKLYANGDYARILRYREAFSRTLWLERNLAERVRLGTYAEDAAIQLGNRSAQAAALIDDLGWTHVALGDYTTARRHITHGRTVASDEGDPYWQAKSERHLAGIAVRKEKYAEANAHLEQANHFAAAIAEAIVRDEMIAGIEYGLAECAHYSHEYPKALAHLETSERLRKQVGDPTRAVRTHSLKGRILMKLERTAEAKDSFRRGLRDAREVGRRDEQIFNLLGLARIAALEGRDVQSVAYRREAGTLQESVPVADVANEFTS